MTSTGTGCPMKLWNCQVLKKTCGWDFWTWISGGSDRAALLVAPDGLRGVFQS